MTDDEHLEEPATRRGRLKALRRGRKQGPRPMAVDGKSVFVIKRLAEERAAVARQATGGPKKRRKR